MRVVVALRAVPPVEAPADDDARLAVLRDLVAAVLRVPPVDFRVPVLALRAPVLRAEVARCAVERDEEPELLPLLSSSVHLPDITRCAASATASAISEPRRDALETIVLAAACAVSAASRPASRILRRAAGLALIAAAAAANPAASISRLIAALASLSKVFLSELPPLLPRLPEDLAMLASLFRSETQKLFIAETVPD